ncbi:MAG TPA: riboflavin kinase [Ureibacillus sp.]|nr:riboflavin kinase [Ureibacillus sp.]
MKDKKLTGRVVTGNQLGRTIGFPTANLQIVKPAIIHQGVYGVRVVCKEQVYVGMMNVGTCPTIAENHVQTIEVHLIDFEGDIYGEVIDVHIAFFIREEKKFASLELLVQQLYKDLAQTKSRLTLMKAEGM